MGFTVGLFEGEAVGIDVGVSEVGKLVGLKVGSVVGWKLGSTVGEDEGISDGGILGVLVGLVGERVGVNVGFLLGFFVFGADVGAILIIRIYANIKEDRFDGKYNSKECYKNVEYCPYRGYNLFANRHL